MASEASTISHPGETHEETQREAADDSTSRNISTENNKTMDGRLSLSKDDENQINEKLSTGDGPPVAESEPIPAAKAVYEKPQQPTETETASPAADETPGTSGGTTAKKAKNIFSMKPETRTTFRNFIVSSKFAGST